MGMARLFTKLFHRSSTEPVVFDTHAAVKLATAISNDWSDSCGAPLQLTLTSKNATKTINVLIRGVAEMPLSNLFHSLDAKCAGNISVESIILDFSTKMIEMAFATQQQPVSNEPVPSVAPRPPTPTPEISVALVGKKRKHDDDSRPEYVLAFF